MSAYLMISLQSEELNELRQAPSPTAKAAQEEMKKHPTWSKRKGWKSTLNNLRLFIQPWCYFNLMKPWLVVIFSPRILHSFCRLFSQIKQLINILLEQSFPRNSCFSSA